jgi:hypothetical protein
MGRHIVVVFLLLWFGSPGASARISRAQPPSKPAAAFTQYLPLMQYPAIIEAVKTVQGVWGDYPTLYYVYGYVRNLTAEPLYSVSIDLEVTIYYPEDPPLLPYAEIVQVTPALTATLPGQINPFTYELWLGKASASIGPIVGVSARSWESGDVYEPLTISGYTYEGSIVNGTVRNDSSQPLHHARVGGVELARCQWREAVLGADTLLPGQETSFSMNNYCGVDEDIIIIGQGAYQP